MIEAIVRLLEVSPVESDVATLVGSVASHDVRDPRERQNVLVRKGATLTEADLRQLVAAGTRELHILVPEAGDVTEDGAAEQLGRIVAGPGVQVDDAHHGQAALRATRRGLLELNRTSLERINGFEGALVFTVDGPRAVEAGATVAAAKSVPLLMPQATLDDVASVCEATGPVVVVRPFLPKRVALVFTDRVRPAAVEQARAHLGTKVRWCGSTLEPVLTGGGDVAAVAQEFRTASASDTDLILAAGGSATDPSDLLFEALRQAGGTVERIGVPVDPGTACWIGRLAGRPVFGLASCELFGRAGAFDVVLPRLLAGDELDLALLRSIAYGGLVAGAPRWPAYDGV
ncbi:MAG: hypothetical protein JO023_26440 [Chloroflexi bacterium]|nr:hypothetical protein [Chloroflexota bacterium]